MAVTDLEHEIAKVVVERFLRLKEATPRGLLVRKFRQPGLLDQMQGRSILQTTDRDAYLPMAVAFHYSGDSDIVRLAKASVEVVLYVLQNLFDVELSKNSFTPADIEAHARKMYDTLDLERIELGLYLIPEFGVLSGWSNGKDRTQLTSLRISENIVTMTDISKVWDEHIRQRVGYAEQEPSSTGVIPDEAEVFIPTSETVDLDWKLIHHEIVNVSKSRFESGHYADAVEAALKHINQFVGDLVKARTGKEYDGADLMQRAFSADKPVLRLDDLATITGKSIQIGYQQIFSGAMKGIRNPKAHGNVQIDSLRAIHFLFLASLLMFKLDEAIELERKAPAFAGLKNSVQAS